MQFSLDMLLPIALLVIFFFMIIMPQRKRDKEVKSMLSSLKKGDDVVTIGGICGTIIMLNDDYAVVKTGDDNMTIKFERSAIRSIIDKSDDSAQEEDA